MADPFYSDARFYDLMHSDQVEDAHFYVKKAKHFGGPLLDVACGTGRITLPIALQGITTTGLDLSLEMLKEAEKKSKALHTNVDWVQGDCRTFSLGKKFRTILIGFNSMLLLTDQNSLESFLGRVNFHLEPNGYFLFDVFNPYMPILTREPSERFPVMSVDDTAKGEEVYIEESTSYDSATQLNHVNWFYTINGIKDAKVLSFVMRCIFPKELEALLFYNGFEIVEKYGDFDESPFQSDSSRQILVCQKLRKS